MYWRIALLLLTAATVCCQGPRWASAEETPVAEVGPEAVRGELPKLLLDLDSDRYFVRQRAVARLEQLSNRAELGSLLAAEFRRILLDPATSLEVRHRLEQLQKRLPPDQPTHPAEVTLEEVRRLIDQMDDDSYAVRLGAARRLEWLTDSPKLAGQVMTGLQQRLADADISPQTRRLLQPSWEKAFQSWLLSDPAETTLPPVTDVQITGWIDDLIAAAQRNREPDVWRRGEVAMRQLRITLARDDHLPRVQAALKRQLSRAELSRVHGTPSGTLLGKLTELVELTRPAMVAECWQRGHHTSEQHLLVDVPSQSLGALRPSHFDRIDDRVAHCVSGSNLTPGDYPVGVAIPHPSDPSAIFHLVNLPTPRRRMAYTYYVNTDEAERFVALTRRTMQYLVERKGLLSRPEFLMLVQLDPREVSRWTGKLLEQIDDRSMAAIGPYSLGQPTSHHGALCAYLAVRGTREATAGLLRAIDTGRILPPTSASPYHLPWVAALGIAGRDPWPEVDAWLAGLVDRTDPLVLGQTDGPDLGATAAAILLRRQRKPAADFDLIRTAQSPIGRLGVIGYRFASARGRTDLQRWWDDHGKQTEGESDGPDE